MAQILLSLTCDLWLADLRSYKEAKWYIFKSKGNGDNNEKNMFGFWGNGFSDRNFAG